MSAEGFGTVEHRVGVCVVGGGMAGLCAALSAARNGVPTVLMHDRPVLGGNASSEIRVHICGADRHNKLPNLRETGILEELRLENLYRNPNASFYLWDLLLYEKAVCQENLTLLLNCTCFDADMEDDRIACVKGVQSTTQSIHVVYADVFIDCSGDAVLAPLSGALYRRGREGRSEYGESLAPEQPDDYTMGMSCMFMAKRYDRPQPFEAPSWAYRFESDDELPLGQRHHVDALWGGEDEGEGFWWIELGGDADSIADTEDLRHELLRIVLGVWDHIKNRGDHGAENWALEWVEFLPGKRESRRYVGAHVLTQRDVEEGGRFEDVVAYGGWPIDEHHPKGFWAWKVGAPPTRFHDVPSPYGIPYRCLYSRNVRNLMFAGRCASATHIAMSSARVMGTGCSMGQAAGTAGAMAAAAGRLPSEVDVKSLQQRLLKDDCYLPGIRMEMPPATVEAALLPSRGDAEAVRDGINRPVGDNEHAWFAGEGDWLEYRFGAPRHISSVMLVLDSALHKNIQMSYHPRVALRRLKVPEECIRSLRVEGFRCGEKVFDNRIDENRMRLVRVGVGETVDVVRVTFSETWGAERSRIHAFVVE